MMLPQDTTKQFYCPGCGFYSDRTEWGRYRIKMETEFHVAIVLLICPLCKNIKSE